MQTTKSLTSELCRAVGTPGREGDVINLIAKKLEGCAELSRTPLGSLVANIGPADAKKTIAVVAHADEIGMVVTYIEDNGFLRVGASGGIDPKTLLGSAVEVFSASGVLHGIVATVPPHLLGESGKKMPEIEEIFIDVGLTGDECKKLVLPGDTAVLRNRPAELLGDFLAAKALDNRACCAALVNLCLELADKLGSLRLSAVFSTMEEVGAFGAATAVYGVNPHAAIVLDTSFGLTPDTSPAKTGKIGGGPMLGIAPILNKKMFEDLKKAAASAEIEYQVEVMGDRTGTDADKIVVSRTGIPTGLVSIPIKNMHTPAECVKISDIDDTTALLAVYIKNFFEETGCPNA